MKKNYSPWLHQLNKERRSEILSRDVETDIAIIGAGIAGVSTAFFILKNTDKNVVLLERYKLAHGATGHNAGQVVSYFERGFESLVNEFGLEMASEGQKAIEDSWALIDEMYSSARLNIPFSSFLGHAGLSSFDQVLLHLKNNFLRKKGGLAPERLYISKEADFLERIPKEYEDLYQIVPSEKVLSILETGEKSFVAALSYKKGCINSALFCEEVILDLIKKYPKRFSFYEHTPIDKVVLHHNEALLDAGKNTVKAGRVILCTNGFESLNIFNETGLDINAKFHHLVHGTVGYMCGYLEKNNKPPVAISYITDPDASTDDPYFYLTRRMYEFEKGKAHNLISVGGPEVSLENSQEYNHEADFPEEMVDLINSFVKKTYDPDPNNTIDYIFSWHGLMGYTKNGVRLVGPEPKNPVLMYNLGCNGIGILPSVYGGKRISDCVSGRPMEKSIFDVPGEYK